MDSFPSRDFSPKNGLLFFLFSSIFLPGSLTLPQQDESKTPRVEIEQGEVVGVLNPSAGFGEVAAFLGIPYGESPTGNLRFRAPKPLKKFSGGKLIADTLALSCFGTKDDTYGDFPGAIMWNAVNAMSEDCLNLNIWVPSKKFNSGEKLPVLVWIYGGGFFSGTPSLPLYEGGVLAASQNVVVVNINYRLGPFGFLFFGEDTEISGNMGLKDQQLALKWIQNNIEQFGGDPNKVTLFGESAGSASVSSHLLSPGSQDLFARAILQSGAMTNRWAYAEHVALKNRSRTLFKSLNCWRGEDKLQESLDCLKQKSGRSIQDVVNVNILLKPMEFAFVPVIRDGEFLPEDVTAMIEKKQFKKCPVIIGTVLDEGTFWLPYTFTDSKIFKFNQTIKPDKQTNPITRKMYETAMNFTFFPYYKSMKYVNKISAHYKDDSNIYLDPERNRQRIKELELRDGVAVAFHDFFFHCDVLSFANALANAGNNQVYAYFFTQRSSINPWPKWTGVMHGYEIEYFFGAPFRNSAYLDSEKQFSRKVMKYWAQFARSSKPGDDWPTFRPEEKKVKILNAKVDETRLLREQNCNFWGRTNKEAGHWQIHSVVSASFFLSPCKMALLSSFLFSVIVPLCFLSSCSRSKID